MLTALLLSRQPISSGQSAKPFSTWPSPLLLLGTYVLVLRRRRSSEAFLQRQEHREHRFRISQEPDDEQQGELTAFIAVPANFFFSFPPCRKDRQSSSPRPKHTTGKQEGRYIGPFLSITVFVPCSLSYGVVFCFLDFHFFTITLSTNIASSSLGICLQPRRSFFPSFVRSAL